MLQLGDLETRARKKKKEEDSFSSLPDEVVVEVFSYLDFFREVMEGVFDVSSRFRRLCTDHITELSVDDELLRGVVQSISRRRRRRLHLPRLRELHVLFPFDYRRNDEDVVPLTAVVLQHCPRLENLNFECDFSVADLCGVIGKHGASLRKLCLLSRDYSLLDPASLRNLTHLYLEHDSLNRMKMELLVAIGEHCKVLECFKILEILRSSDMPPQDDGNGAEAAAVAGFFQSVRKTLKGLSWGTGLGSGGLKAALGSCLLLESLEIVSNKQNNMGPLGADLLVDIFQLPRLKELDIWTPDSSKDLCGAFAAASSKQLLSGLTALGLHAPGLDDASLAAVARACPRLLCLSLTEYKGSMSKVGLGSIAGARCGKTLEKVGLYCPKLPDAELLEIIEIMTPNLKRVECDKRPHLSPKLASLGIKVGEFLTEYIKPGFSFSKQGKKILYPEIYDD